MSNPLQNSSLSRLELGIARRLVIAGALASLFVYNARLSAKSDKSARSDMASGSQPPKPTGSHLLTLLLYSLLQRSRMHEKERVEARKRKNKQKGAWPEEGEACKQDEFRLRPTFDATERELISLVAATLRKIVKQEMERPTTADKNMLLPLAQKMGQIIGCSSKQIWTELVEGLGNTCTYGFEMARNEPNGNWPVRVLYCTVYYGKVFKNQLGVMAFLEARLLARLWRLSKNGA